MMAAWRRRAARSVDVSAGCRQGRDHRPRAAGQLGAAAPLRGQRVPDDLGAVGPSDRERGRQVGPSDRERGRAAT